MDGVLADEKLPTEIKTQKYDQMLQRYLNVQSQIENVVSTVRIQSTEEKEPSNTDEMLTSQATKEAIPETSTPVGINPSLKQTFCKRFQERIELKQKGYFLG